ncbi:unnamed protein product [Medioppia subpectinata]|uniref:legumain n=1 Tax=Medioppia subpectinata TaxID=1979941 RepID=A0A7R9PWW7_9ACAR|nr:unnamed protein product [Medioppia subpectinata]CAG2104198.1 unnamed protein product [Medioppia subpectinata]
MKVFIILAVLYVTANAVPFAHELAEPFNGTNWVVLCAGGYTWSNYRHQSNVYHAYQIIKAHGIPESNIVVMHYDDLAQNKENPTPGIVVNTLGGPDVYKGVPKDYTGTEVTPEATVLKGDKSLAQNGKKVVNSGPNDHIYVYFIDHGAPDLIAFPHKYLYSKDLNGAFKEMHQAKKYAKLVVNIEACNSGSMFEKPLPKDINVYVTTSANPQESSYAKDYDNLRHTYLGDYYSGAWLEVIEKQDLTKETLEQSYKYTVSSQNKSHPQQYGTLAINKLTVSQFLG